MISISKREMGEFLKLSGVHMVGIGAKQVQGKQTSTPAIICFVETKVPAENLGPGALVPKFITTNLGETIPTDVIQRPRFKMNSGQAPNAGLHQQKYRPVQAGISTSVESVGGTGTITSTQWTDNADGKRVLASNNHVWAHNGFDGVMIGAKLVQPGVYDAKDSPDLVIGKLKRFVDVIEVPQPDAVVPPESEFNFIDLALCDPDESVAISDETLEVGRCPGTYIVTYNDPINYTQFQISSRTDGLVNCIVTGTSMMGWIMSPRNTYTFFVDQIALEPNSVHAGDSGSPLLKRDTHELCGTIFAGATDGSGLANDVQYVAKYGNLTFRPGSDTPPVTPPVTPPSGRVGLSTSSNIVAINISGVPPITPPVNPPSGENSKLTLSVDATSYSPGATVTASSKLVFASDSTSMIGRSVQYMLNPGAQIVGSAVTDASGNSSITFLAPTVTSTLVAMFSGDQVTSTPTSEPKLNSAGCGPISILYMMPPVTPMPGVTVGNSGETPLPRVPGSVDPVMTLGTDAGAYMYGKAPIITMTGKYPDGTPIVGKPFVVFMSGYQPSNQWASYTKMSDNNGKAVWDNLVPFAQPPVHPGGDPGEWSIGFTCEYLGDGDTSTRIMRR